MTFKHIPIMLNECIDGLQIKPNGIYFDGTLGGAGHSLDIAKKLSPKGMLIGVDRDATALKAAQKILETFENITYIHDNHDNIKKILSNLKCEKVDGILLDLGISSYQIDEKARGFSYMKESSLDMRMDERQTLSAKVIVNQYSEKQLADIIYQYGEEKFSRQIAKKICEYREQKQIETTTQLVEIIKSAIPTKFLNKGGHPAKKTFQAIRIETNDELKPLYNTVMDSINALKQGGRLCVITFHSLEDRIVKTAFNDAVGQCICPPTLPYCACGVESKGKMINKKPIIPSKEELETNTRSASAKLRIFERN